MKKISWYNPLLNYNKLLSSVFAMAMISGVKAADPVIMGLAEDGWEIGELIYEDNFDNPDNWSVQIANENGESTFADGKLEIRSPRGGCSAWLKREFDGPIAIVYDAVYPNDNLSNGDYRLSDLNNYWNFTDPSGIDPNEPGGMFDETIDHAIGLYNGYYASTGGHSNTTHRFRNFPRDGAPHLASFAQDGNSDFFLEAEVTRSVQLVAADGLVQHISGGKILYEFEEGDILSVDGGSSGETGVLGSAAYPSHYSGYFAFRTTWSHVIYSGLKVYRMNPVDVPSKLVNISTRGHVSEGNGVLIGGFAIDGGKRMTVLVQGVGDELASIDSSLSGKTLSDVRISLYDISGALIESNDDWGDADFGLKSVAMKDVGAVNLDSGSQSSSLLVELEPGIYTVILSGVASDEGVALIEAYEVDASTLEGADVVDPNNPSVVGSWTFDDVSGATVLDSSSQGNDGTLTGGTVVAGQLGDAMSFNGSSDTLDIPASVFDSISNEITVSMWVYGVNQPRGDTLFRAIDASGNRILNIHLPWENSQVYWDSGNDGNGYDRLNETAEASQFEGVWNHWVFTKNAVTGSLKIYHNGSLFASGTGFTKTISGITQARIGSGVDDTFYEGSVDEFLIYNKELSASEVSTLYNSY